MDWIVGHRGRALPWLASLMVLLATALIDRQWRNEEEAERNAAESRAQEQVSVLSDALGNVLSERMGALAAPKLRFTPVEDSLAERAFAVAVDSVTVTLSGLQAISVVHGDGRVSPGSDALLGRPGLDPAEDSIVGAPFLRAMETGQPAATGLITGFGARRVVVFDPVLLGQIGAPQAALAAEIDPLAVYRVALGMLEGNTLRSGLYSLRAPDGTQITTSPAPVGWPTVERPVRFADTQWLVQLSYPPVDASPYAGARLATWITGFALALALAAVLAILRQTVLRQRDQIARREAAELRARAAADEARGLSAQLAAAHSAAQRLSTSLDPEYVLEFFLGRVAEVLDADAASLYTFDEEGYLVGRSRLVMRDSRPETDRLKGEDIRQVRAPPALLPQLAEAVSTGEPQVVEDSSGMREPTGLPHGVRSPAGWVTIPLQVGGSMVGVAVWEVFGDPHPFDGKDVVFAEALGAQAAAALRTADLYASLEAASARATWEASRFGAVLDQMADGVVIADARGRIERSNAAADALLSGPPIAGGVDEWARHLDLTTADRRPLPRGEFPILRALRGEIVRRVDLIARSSAHEDRHLSASAIPIVTESGKPAGAAMVVRDNTDEQQYAEMLRHTNQELRKQATLLEETNRELRAATAAKDQFLAVVSHELRTPVNAIMGYAELLDLEIKGSLNGEQKEMLRRLRQTAWHLLRLIDEILDLPKAESGEIELHLERVDIRDILETALDQVTPLANAKGLDLEVQHRGTGRDGLVAYADRTRLTQVILNLLSNAVKFTESGGVEVRSSENGDGFVEVRVKDTGPGIPRDEQERIFDSFYQVEGGLTRRAGGTGLGLAITRRFVRLMGGDVTVHSLPGEGAEFVVRVPSAKAVDEARPSRGAGDAGGRPR